MHKSGVLRSTEPFQYDSRVQSRIIYVSMGLLYDPIGFFEPVRLLSRIGGDVTTSSSYLLEHKPQYS